MNDPSTRVKISEPWNPGEDIKQGTANSWPFIRFLFDVAVARGKISAEELANRSSGFYHLGSMPPGESWQADLMKADNWLAIPIPNIR